MKLIRCYLYRELVLLPTVKQTEAGFYLDCDPVIVHPVAERKKLHAALVSRMQSNNQVVATPAVCAEAGSVLLDWLSLEKWSSFEKQAVLYTIILGGSYATIYMSGRGRDGMWSGANSGKRQFHPSVHTDMLAQTIIDEMSSQPEAHAERFALACLAKS
jgi:hypothetical protein